MRFDRDPDHASTGRSDRRRRPHRGVRQVGQALADIHVAQWPKSKHALLREAIQSTLQNDKPDPRLAV